MRINNNKKKKKNYIFDHFPSQLVVMTCGAKQFKRHCVVRPYDDNEGAFNL